MERTLRLERVYKLSDYNTLRVSDELLDLPEEVIKDENLVGLIRTLQLAGIEKTYQQYILWYKNYIVGKSQDDVIEFLVNTEKTTMKELKKLFDREEIKND